MSGKQKTSTQKGKVSQESNKLTNASDVAPEDDLSLPMSALKAELEKNRVAILAEINASLAPINSTLDEVRAKFDTYEPRITEMEVCLSDHSDRLDYLEKQVGSLVKEKNQLLAKTEDLENRSRRNNLRIIGLPEGREGQAATAFMSRFFVDLLQDETFTDPPELDRAHRALYAKPTKDEKPRPVIVRFLRFQQKEQVLTIARKKQLFYDGHRILVFPDISSALAKKRAAFNPVKAKLYHKGVKFFLRYPAVLCFTHQQKDYKFECVNAAEDFFKEHFLCDADA